MSRFEVLAVITSDRGPQFTSSLWTALCELLNIQHSQTTAHHPQSNQSNGMVERFNHRLKDALRARCAAANWVDYLPWSCLAREDDGCTTPAQAVFGTPLILPGHFLDSPKLLQKTFLGNFLKDTKCRRSCQRTWPTHTSPRCSSGGMATYRRSNPSTTAPTSSFVATGRTRCPVHPPAEALHRSYRATCTA